ncbi:MAG: DNA repair protein RecO [Patescibacteria group bacterium]
MTKQTFNTTSIVLNRVPYGENDLKVSLLTKDKGRIEVVARGAKKLKSKLAAHLEPFTVSDVMIVRGKQRNYAGSAVGNFFYQAVKSDPSKVYYAGAGSAVMLKNIKENDRDSSEYFQLLRMFLDLLQEKENDDLLGCKVLHSLFLFKFFQIYGCGPNISHCFQCGKKIEPGNNFFNIKESSVFCKGCFRGNTDQYKLTISDNCIKIMKLVLDDGLAKGDKVKIDNPRLSLELSTLAGKFYAYNFGTSKF